MKIVWTRQSIEDIEAIRAYVERDSLRYATLLVERLFAAVDRLSEFPASGRIVPEVGDETIREVLQGSYRLVYRLRAQTVEILTVHHAARLLRL